MTPIDYIIIAFGALFGIVGFARGFLIGALSLAGFAAGAYLGTRFGPQLLEEGHTSPYAPLFGLLGALVGGVLISSIFEGIAGRIREGVPGGLAIIDGLAGSALAVALALGLAWLLSVILLQTPGIRDLRRPIQQSKILTELNAVLPSDRVLKALARFDPLPNFKGPDVQHLAPPRGTVAADPQVRGAGDSVVRVLGNSCGLGVAGSGWVAGAGIVVTNAHVIAGQEETVVQTRSGRSAIEATAIAFDPSNDVAVLRVPGLDAPSLGFAGEVKISEPGGAEGYPLNGPFTISPIRVGRTATVLAPDAYGRRLVRRKVTAFRGTVQPGNSGGPLVDVAGRVSGTVFSKTVDGGPPGGYAVPNDIVRDTLGGASGRVSTGPCAR
jgi:Trypsin-like peptidase domain/Colicin V production protein